MVLRPLRGGGPKAGPLGGPGPGVSWTGIGWCYAWRAVYPKVSLERGRRVGGGACTFFLWRSVPLALRIQHSWFIFQVISKSLF